MYSKIILLLFGLGLLAVGCNQVSAQLERYDLNAAEFAAKSSATPEAAILDVRTPAEFEKGHLYQATNMDWNAVDFGQRSSTLNKDQPVFVYCLSGGRSSAAAQQLRKEGFRKVYELNGGIIKWRSMGLPETKSATIAGLSNAQYTALITSTKAVLVDFYADWCAPCKKMKPFLDEISTERAEEVTIQRINADDHKELCKSLNINALPTLLLYKDQTIVWRHEGFLAKADLLKVLQQY